MTCAAWKSSTYYITVIDSPKVIVSASLRESNPIYVLVISLLPVYHSRTQGTLYSLGLCTMSLPLVTGFEQNSLLLDKVELILTLTAVENTIAAYFVSAWLYWWFLTLHLNNNSELYLFYVYTLGVQVH